jgi:hypothetical protein
MVIESKETRELREQDLVLDLAPMITIPRCVSMPSGQTILTRAIAVS